MEMVCLEELAFKWMFHRGNLCDLHKQCQQYVLETAEDKMKEKSVYRLIFSIDVGELLDFDAHLGNMVCRSTEKALEIFQEACFVCIKILDWIPQVISKRQIVLQIRYMSVPHFISCSSISVLRRHLSESYGKSLPLFTTTGTISGMTSRANYVRSTWYKCLDTTCDSCGNGFVKHYPNTSGSELSSPELVCSECGTILEEDISCRVLGEKCLLQIVSSDGFSNSADKQNKVDRLYRPILVYIRDELINDVELGGCFSFSLVPFRELSAPQFAATTQLNLVFEANNLVKISPTPVVPLQFVPTNFVPFNDFTGKFKTLYSLYQGQKGSAWSFPATLAFLFADTITPRGTYFRLKLALLLSIVSQQSSDIDDQTKTTTGGRLHLLIVSKDILHLQKLLLFSRSFITPSVVFSPCNDLCYSVSKDSLSTKSCMINGGCLPLANGGVCVLTNLDELKGDQMNELEAVLQTQSVIVEVPRKYLGCQESQIIIPISCKVWACCETTKKQGTKVQANACQIIQENGRLSRALIDNFSLLFNINDNEMSSSTIFGDNLITEEILNKATLGKGSSMDTIADVEFSEFINYVSAIKLSFSEKARELIQGFYLSCRRVRNSSRQSGSEFPITALKTMMSLAEAHARLSIRTEVTEDDATLAILLYEESITARVGYSVFGLSTFHHFKDDNFMAYTGLENDERMTQLKIHIKRFCSLHSNYKYIPGHFIREE